MIGKAEKSAPKRSSRTHIEKQIWDNNMQSIFEENVRNQLFLEEMNRATSILKQSVDDAVKCLSEGLLRAAECMVRNVYTGPRQSVWFDCE